MPCAGCNSPSSGKDPAASCDGKVPCPPPPPPPPPPIPPSPPTPVAAWTVDDLKKNLAACDGGTGVWSSAKAANGGGDPTILVGDVSGGGQVNAAAGVITLDRSQDKCFATQVMIQELSNLSQKSALQKAHSDAAAGNLSREEYIKAIELAEYDGVRKVIKAFDACKDKWGCTTCEKEWARKYTTFDDYYAKALSNDHKEFYGKRWDAQFKAAYEKKHPPSPPPKSP